MSAEGSKKDDGGAKSDTDSDIFDKIRSLFGGAICEALRSKFKFNLADEHQFYCETSMLFNLRLLSLTISNISQIDFKLSVEIFGSLVELNYASLSFPALEG